MVEQSLETPARVPAITTCADSAVGQANALNSSRMPEILIRGTLPRRDLPTLRSLNLWASDATLRGLV